MKQWKTKTKTKTSKTQRNKKAQEKQTYPLPPKKPKKYPTKAKNPINPGLQDNCTKESAESNGDGLPHCVRSREWLKSSAEDMVSIVLVRGLPWGSS